MSIRGACASYGVMAGFVPAIHVFMKDQRNLRCEALGSSPRAAHSLCECLLKKSVFRRPGGFGGEPEPDPIPNSAVKLPSADGTKSQDLEE